MLSSWGYTTAAVDIKHNKQQQQQQQVSTTDIITQHVITGFMVNTWYVAHLLLLL